MLLAGALLSLVAIVAFGGVASAEDQITVTVNGKTTEVTDTNAKECITDHLSSGGTVDDCQKAPSPIIPAKNEFIWGAISFIVLFFLLWKFAWPGLKKGMEARTERIQGDIESAETAKAEAETVLADYRAQLADARSEGARIVEEARQQADALKRDQEQRLQTELAQMRERAAADVEAAKAQALADLRHDVASLAVGAAEVVVRNNLDASTQQRLVDQYIDELVNRRN
jgi:F-type H+-transporting ATPase subunit b